MELKFAITAEHASRSDGQKISVVDLFRQVAPEGFPSELERCFLVVEWEAQPHEVGSEQRIVTLLDRPDGTRDFLSSNLPFRVPAEPAMMGMPIILHAIVDLSGLLLASPGLHTIRILANEEEKGSASLYVHGTGE